MPAPQSSPHLQSPNSRQVFASAMQGNRPRASVMEMPPPSPSPHYSPRPSMQNQQPSRTPLYSRVPYLHSPRQQAASPSDPYASSPMTPQPASDPYAHPPNTPRPVMSSENENFSNDSYQKIMTDTYSGTPPGEMDMAAGMSSPRPQPPQGQETRQHLRDLLQRQQIKKLEQDQMSPGRNELSSPGTPRPVSWSSGNNNNLVQPFWTFIIFYGDLSKLCIFMRSGLCGVILMNVSSNFQTSGKRQVRWNKITLLDTNLTVLVLHKFSSKISLDIHFYHLKVDLVVRHSKLQCPVQIAR